MAGHVSDNHRAKLSFTDTESHLDGLYMEHDVIIPSAVCSSAPHSQDAVEAMLHLCIDDRKRPTSVRRRFSRTRAGLGIPIPGGRAFTSSKNECRREVLSCHLMLHLWSPILLRWCPVRLHLLAVPEQQAQRGALA